MSKKNKHQHHGENPFKENENINSEENTTIEKELKLKKQNLSIWGLKMH